MTSTRTIHGTSNTTTLVAVPTLTQANLTLVDQGQSADGLTRTATYALASGDENYPVALRVAIYRKPQGNGGNGEIVTTVKISTYAVETDDSDSSVISVQPCSASLTVAMPGTNPVFEEAEFMELVAHLYSLFFTGVDGSNVPNSVIVDKLKFAIPNVY